MTRDYVLVHGMSHGAWCWDLLSERLTRQGHRVVALDLPGHGRRAAEWRRASIQSYARSVADAMAHEGVHDAVLVGHSMAGVVIPKVAELVPARIGHIVFLAAVVLPSGGSLLETQLSPAARALFTGSGRAGGGAVLYPGAMASSRWMGDLPPGDERVDLSRFYALAIPRTTSAACATSPSPWPAPPSTPRGSE